MYLRVMNIVLATVLLLGSRLSLSQACKLDFPKTDSCDEKTFKNFKPCGDGYCCCNLKNVCSNFGHKLTYIPRMPSTCFLLFQNNNLTYISEGTFSNISKPLVLTKLNLCNNSITGIFPSAFLKLTALKYLDLSNNIGINLTDLGFSFRYTRFLETLILRNVGITHLHKDIFRFLHSSRLEVLDLNENNFALLDFSFFLFTKGLRHLNLVNCNVRDIRVSVAFPNLELLYLRTNYLGNPPPSFCLENSTKTAFPTLKLIDLSDNVISDLDARILQCLETLQTLHIERNIFSTLKNNIFSRFPNLSYLYIQDMGQHLKIIEPFAFNLPRLRKLFLSNNNIKFNNDRNIHILKGLSGLDELQISLSNFYGINADIQADIFSSLTNLTVFVCQGCKIDFINSALFSKFPNLVTVNLNGNAIMSINGAFDSSSNLKNIYLENNKVVTVKATDFSLDLLKTLEILDLSSNPFNCTCDLMWFRNIIGENGVIANRTKLYHWPSRYLCHKTKTERMRLQDFRPTAKFCSVSNILRTVVIALSAVMLLTIISSVVAYRRRWFIRYWFYKLRKKYKPLRNEQEPLLRGVGAAFDAYIIYHDSDADFAHFELLRYLEGELDYKLYLWQRDAEPGGSKMNMTFDAIDSSRVVIGIVSTDFLQDNWCRFQLEVAIDRDITRKHESIFLILFDNIDLKILDKYWCMILTRTPSGTWCSDHSKIERKVFDQTIEKIMIKTKRNEIINDSH